SRKILTQGVGELLQQVQLNATQGLLGVADVCLRGTDVPLVAIPYRNWKLQSEPKLVVARYDTELIGRSDRDVRKRLDFGTLQENLATRDIGLRDLNKRIAANGI